RETTHGLYEALLSGRFAFDYVHEDRLDPEPLSKYRALLLPNVAMLSDRQCQQIRDYVHGGGSIMASFETSLYDENMKQRAEFGLSRTVCFPGDIERTWWLTGHGDLLRLLHNTIRWLTRDERVVHVQGAGFVEMFAWETFPGYAVHLLNYTTPNAHHGWVQSVYPLGAQTVSMKLPAGVKVKSVELLRAEQTVPFRLEDGILRFTIPRVEDY